jgi:FkbM family methyltransferase
MAALRITDVVPVTQEYPEIAPKTDPFGGTYMGGGVVMTRLWSKHLFLTSTGDMIVTPHLLDAGINEPHVTRTLMSLTQAGDVMVDIGANAGYYSVLCAWRAHPGGQVWAFEPIPKLYRIMSDNLHNNGFAGMAQRRQMALSDHNGTASLRVFEGYEATSTLRDVPEAFIANTAAETGRPSHLIDVAVARLDDEMANIAEIHVMKIDAEGHEPAIIRGAQEILQRSRNLKIVMEFVPPIMGRDESMGLLAMLRDLDFIIYRIETDASLVRFDSDDELVNLPFSDLLLVKSGAQ